MTRRAAAGHTCAILAACGVLAYCMDRWPNATVTVTAAAGIYLRLREGQADELEGSPGRLRGHTGRAGGRRR